MKEESALHPVYIFVVSCRLVVTRNIIIVHFLARDGSFGLNEDFMAKEVIGDGGRSAAVVVIFTCILRRHFLAQMM